MLNPYWAEELGGTGRQSNKRTFAYYIWIRYGFLNTGHIHHEGTLINSFRVFRSYRYKQKADFANTNDMTLIKLR
jgi:hypothetical protein